ncbi:MAG: hypothetical protein HPY55_08740 [Firmicutes bacterium]|nr:hypothetical protein [Bacillota bacterium]
MLRRSLVLLLTMALLISFSAVASADDSPFTLQILTPSGDPTAGQATKDIGVPGVGLVPFGLYYYFPGQTIRLRVAPRPGVSLPEPQTQYRVYASFASVDGTSNRVNGVWNSGSYWDIQYAINSSWEVGESPVCQIPIYCEFDFPQSQTVQVGTMIAVIDLNPRDIPDSGLGGETTDWETIEDFTAIPSLTFERFEGGTAVGKLVIQGPINLCEVDDGGQPTTARALLELDNNLEIESGEMNINTAADALAALNQPASLTMYNLPYISSPGIVYEDNYGTRTVALDPGEDASQDTTGKISGLSWNSDQRSLTLTVGGWSGYSTFPKVAAVASDVYVTMASGNTTLSSDNKWVLQVTDGTVKTGVSAADLSVSNLPSGLSIAAAKGSDNSIQITVSGTASAAVTTPVAVDVVVKGSAVTQANAIDSEPVTAYVQPHQPSSNNNLASLTLTRGSLTPSFSSGIQDYTVSVAHSVYSIDLTPTVADPGATLKIDGEDHSSGTPATIDLSGGTTTVTITVIAETGAEKEYVVSIQRADVSSDATLGNLTVSSGSLSPAFSAGETSYTVSVGNSVSSIQITPTAGHEFAAIKVNDSACDSGSAKTVNLSVGANTVTVVVTAEDGSTTETYTITVTRAASSGGNGSSSSSTPAYRPTISGDRADVNAGAQVSTSTNADGSTTAGVTVRADVIQSALASGSGVRDIVVQVTQAATEQAAIVPANAFAAMAGSQANLVVETARGTLHVPAEAIDVAGLARQLGVSASDMQVRVSVREVSGDDDQYLRRRATSADPALKPVTRALEFTIEAVAGDRRVTVESFGGKLVRGEFPLGSGDAGQVSDPRKLCVYRYDEQTRQWAPVQSRVDLENMKVIFFTPSFSKYTVMAYEKSFADLAGHWAKADVELVASRHVVKGMTADQFVPENKVTRAEFATMLVRALGLSVPARPQPGFIDISATDWCAGFVEAAVKARLVNGYDDGTFRANRTITRQEMAAMIVRALKVVGKDASVSAAEETSLLQGFGDAGLVQSWAKSDVAKALKSGLIKGMTPASFAPADNATRAQSATVIKRLMEQAGLF